MDKHQRDHGQLPEVSHVRQPDNALIAIGFGAFLLLFPLISGQSITWWNVVAAVLFVVVFYVSQILYNRRRRKNHERPNP